jgi:hypothetical protein
MARYFTPTPSQYISQFVPPDLDLMYKVGQEKAANDAAITDSLDKADQEWKVKGGIFTNKQDAELFNQETEANLSKIKDAFYTGSIDSFQAARAINRLQGVVKNNKRYRLYKLDEELTNKNLLPNLAAGKLNNALGVNINGVNTIDLRGGDLKVNAKIDPNSTTEEQLGTWYNMQTPGELDKDHVAFIQQASKDKVIEYTAAKNGYGIKYVTDPSTKDKIPVFYNAKGDFVKTGIDRNDVKNYAISYSNTEWEKGSDKQSVDYLKRAGFDKDYYAERLTDLIMPGVSNVKDDRSISASPMSTGDGDGNNKNKFDYTAYVPTPGIPVKAVGGSGAEIKSNFKSFVKGTKTIEISPNESDPNAAFYGVSTELTNSFKWSNFNDKEKNVIAQYFEILDMPEFAEKIRKGQTYGKDTKLVYNKKDIGTMGEHIQKIIDSGYLDRLNNMPIVANEIVGEEINYDAFGIKTSSTSAPSLFDLLSSKLKDAQAYNPENGSLKKFSEIFVGQQNLKDIPVGIYNISADNNLKTLTGTKENWGNAVKVQVGDKSYYLTGYKYGSKDPNVNNYLETQASINNEINEIENLRYALPGTKHYTYNNEGKKDGFIVFDNKNQVFNAYDLNNNIVAQSANAYFQ